MQRITAAHLSACRPRQRRPSATNNKPAGSPRYGSPSWASPSTRCAGRALSANTKPINPLYPIVALTYPVIGINFHDDATPQLVDYSQNALDSDRAILDGMARATAVVREIDGKAEVIGESMGSMSDGKIHRNVQSQQQVRKAWQELRDDRQERRESRRQQWQEKRADRLDRVAQRVERLKQTRAERQADRAESLGQPE